MELSFAHFDYTRNLEQQRILFKDCFPETEGDAVQENAHYLWKFHNNPDKDSSWEYISSYDKEIVGYYAALAYRYKLKEKISTVGMVCDVMTSSKYRGKGIFTKLGTYSTTELSQVVPFIMGYPIRKEVIPGHLKIGWKIPFSLPLYIKFIRSNSLLKSKKLGVLSPFVNILLNLVNHILKTKVRGKYQYNLATNIADVEGYDDLVNNWSATVPNTLIKDLSFAKWRYSAPSRTYRFLTVRNSENKLIGFVSFRNIIKEGVPSYGILDYMVLPDYKDCHGLIQETLTDLAKKEKTELIMTMMSKKSASDYYLLKNGFFKSPFVFQLIIKNLSQEFTDEELNNEGNWHLMWVDSDDL
jgi:hypothetical protein